MTATNESAHYVKSSEEVTENTSSSSSSSDDNVTLVTGDEVKSKSKEIWRNLTKREKAEKISMAVTSYSNFGINNEVMDSLFYPILEALSTQQITKLLDFTNEPINWCKCNNCGPVEHESEQICCKIFNCSSTYECATQDPHILEVIKNILEKHEKDERNKNNMKCAREDAYTEVANLLYENKCDSKKRLRIQRIVPSCIRKRIRGMFPDQFMQYCGYMQNAEQ